MFKFKHKWAHYDIQLWDSHQYTNKTPFHKIALIFLIFALEESLPMHDILRIL